MALVYRATGRKSTIKDITNISYILDDNELGIKSGRLYYGLDGTNTPVKGIGTIIEPHYEIGTTIKVTGINAGSLGEMSVTDDYVYICVKAGNETSAIWKRFTLFVTTTNHAGILGDMIVSDDYIYICIVGGDSSTAVWKRWALFKTN